MEPWALGERQLQPLELMYAPLSNYICVLHVCVCVCVASKRAQGIKVFATKPEDLGSIPRTNMMGGNHSHKLYSDDHIKTVTHACTCRHIRNKMLFNF